MAGKIAPRPSSPFSRSSIQASARRVARARMARGMNGSIGARSGRAQEQLRQRRARARGSNGVPAPAAWRTVRGCATPRGFFASGLRVQRMNSGTITVRDQYDTLSRWNGNQRGSSMISTGM